MAREQERQDQLRLLPPEEYEQNQAYEQAWEEEAGLDDSPEGTGSRETGTAQLGQEGAGEHPEEGVSREQEEPGESAELAHPRSLGQENQNRGLAVEVPVGAPAEIMGHNPASLDFQEVVFAAVPEFKAALEGGQGDAFVEAVEAWARSKPYGEASEYLRIIQTGSAGETIALLRQFQQEGQSGEGASGFMDHGAGLVGRAEDVRDNQSPMPNQAQTLQEAVFAASPEFQRAVVQGQGREFMRELVAWAETKPPAESSRYFEAMESGNVAQAMYVLTQFSRDRKKHQRVQQAAAAMAAVPGSHQPFGGSLGGRKSDYDAAWDEKE